MDPSTGTTLRYRLSLILIYEKHCKLLLNLNKKCILAVDFNVDLIKYGDSKTIDDFYDELSSHSFRPLILQPTRVTSKTLSIIDNIFTNDITCFSSGGNLTTSISDHFSQFSQLDIFDKIQENKKVQFGRNWRAFNKHEFKDELSSSIGMMSAPPTSILIPAY